MKDEFVIFPTYLNENLVVTLGRETKAKLAHIACSRLDLMDCRSTIYPQHLWHAGSRGVLQHKEHEDTSPCYHATTGGVNAHTLRVPDAKSSAPPDSF